MTEILGSFVKTFDAVKQFVCVVNIQQLRRKKLNRKENMCRKADVTLSENCKSGSE